MGEITTNNYINLKDKYKKEFEITERQKGALKLLLKRAIDLIERNSKSQQELQIKVNKIFNFFSELNGETFEEMFGKISIEIMEKRQYEEMEREIEKYLGDE